MIESEIKLECVLCTTEDAQLVMNWRNDPFTLAMSYHNSPKEWDSFFREFTEDYFVFPDLPPLFALYEGNRVAFLRFKPINHPQDPLKRCCELSINVAPAFRNQGIGLKVLMQSMHWIAQQGFDDLYAEVKKENLISIKTFINAGFLRLNDEIKWIFDLDVSFPICRFIAPLKDHGTEEKEVFIIAEAGSNWRVGSLHQDIIMAKSLIVAAAEAGANAVKFQVFRPETIYVSNAGNFEYLEKAGINDKMSDLFAFLSMPYEMIPELASECQKYQISFMATPFSQSDFEAVDPFVSLHKVASYEIGHLHLLECAAKSKKPILLSTGAANEEEIAWSVNYLKSHHCGPLTLLQCTASYPADPASMHLRSIPWLKQRFKVNVGLSDHSRHPLYAPISAVALGAKVIEKHLTMDRHLPGPDHAFAIMPDELKELVKAIRQTEKMMGSSIKRVDDTEQELRLHARRGIQSLCEIKIGDHFVEGRNIAILRPGKRVLGVHPKFLYDILGKSAKREIRQGDGLQNGDW